MNNIKKYLISTTKSASEKYSNYKITLCIEFEELEKEKINSKLMFLFLQDVLNFDPHIAKDSFNNTVKRYSNETIKYNLKRISYSKQFKYSDIQYESDVVFNGVDQCYDECFHLTLHKLIYMFRVHQYKITTELLDKIKINRNNA